MKKVDRQECRPRDEFVETDPRLTFQDGQGDERETLPTKRYKSSLKRQESAK